MSEKELNPLEAMLAQYELNNKPKYVAKAESTYNPNNYFNTALDKGVDMLNKEIRILPPSNSSTPFEEVYIHTFTLDGKSQKTPCLKHLNNEPCPFCEAREALLATGKDSDKELAKKYNARKTYIVKVIDRDHEDHGVKFWRFNEDYTKKGVYDKIYGIITSLKSNKDVSNGDSGRDLSLTINRDQKGFAVVTSITPLDSTSLSENAEQKSEWLSDKRTWRDVYGVKKYDYLEIIVKGGTPVWDKEEKKYVDKLVKTDDGGAGMQQEITMGLENLKASTTVPTPTKQDDYDSDLPF